MNIMNTKQLITGIAIGAAAGAVLGVLFAPDKGSKTRKKIADKASDLSDTIKDRFNSVAGSLESKYEELKGKSKEAAHNAKDKMRSMKAEAENAIS